MNEPLISVIMNCYNGDKYLEESIKSVLDQTYKNWEVIFWDNASDDRSIDIVREINDSRIKIYTNEKNVPLGTARNLAIKKASGVLITFLDVDDLWMPTKLEKQIKLYEKKPKVSVIYCDAYFIDGLKFTERLFSKSTFLGMPEGNVFNYLLEQNFVNWQTVMINREVSSGELYFDDRFSYIEDYELLIRLARKGDFFRVKEALVYYRLHSDSISSKDKEIQIDEVEKLYSKLKSDSDINTRSLSYLFVNIYSKKARFFYGKKHYLTAFIFLCRVFVRKPKVVMYFLNKTLFN